MRVLNKSALASVIAASLIAGAYSGAANAVVVDGGKIYVTGRVISAPCSVVADNRDLNIDLGNISRRTLFLPPLHSPLVTAKIQLEDCTLSSDLSTGGTANIGSTAGAKYSSVSVSFSGLRTDVPTGAVATSINTDTFANTATGNPALGVAVALFSQTGQQLLNADLKNFSSELKEGHNDINFKVAAVPTIRRPSYTDESKITAGDIETVISYTLEYK